MASSIASQLQAIKSHLRIAPEPLKRPFTRPSILFDPKEAADIDLRTILPIALSGLEVMIGLDSRFHPYKSTLFGNASLEVDREKVAPKEEEKINKSITSYLRLLAGHLQLPAAAKTLEYLIRRYLVHVFNVDDLILCALPYHDTHVFVRIVQLIDLRNNKWSFLEGVKATGAAPPRKVIIQQCIRDKGLLEILCNYTSSTREFGHGRTVICFCTAVVVEALGSVQKLDDDTVKRVLPFVFNGLNPTMKGGREEKAGALMIVGIVATRSSLAPKLVNNLLFCISRMAQQDANESEDLSWFRVVLMALISIVQSQSVQVLPEKSLKILVHLRDLPGVLAVLSRDFNIKKFLSIFLETLAFYSCSDDQCCSILASLVEVVSVKDIVQRITVKLLGTCIKSSQSLEKSALQDIGRRARSILEVLIKSYKHEASSAIRIVLENHKHGMDEVALVKTLSLLFDGSSEKHPENSELDKLISRKHPSMLENTEDAILQRLHDDDLNIVLAALSVDGLLHLGSPFCFLKAFQDVLIRCMHILKTSASDLSTQACNVCVSCLNAAVLNCPVDDLNYMKEVSNMIFPFLLILPKTRKINLRALELAKDIKWGFYLDSSPFLDVPVDGSMEILDADQIASLNLKITRGFANSLRKNLGKHIEWLTECCKNFDPSKSLVLYIILQLVLDFEGSIHDLQQLYNVCFPIVKDVWPGVEPKGNLFRAEEFDTGKLESASRICMSELLSYNFDSGNGLILLSICWGFLNAFAVRLQNDVQVHDSPQQVVLDDLFLFLASSSQKLVTREHAFFLATKCTHSPVQFLSRFYTEDFPAIVQEEGLLCFARVCLGFDKTNIMNNNGLLELLTSFPSLLVPLSCERKSTRMAAISCIDELFKLWHHFDISKVKNGSNSSLIDCISSPIFGKFMGLIISQKKFILSDANFLPQFMASMLGPSLESFTVPQNSSERFTNQSKNSILASILNSVLEMPTYAKVILFSLFKGTGHAILKVKGVRQLLSGLLERRNEKLIGNPSHSLSAAEVQVICLLLEASLLPTTSDFSNDHLINNLLKALEVGNHVSDDAAIVKPCVTALQNVTHVLCASLKDENLDELFCRLAFLFHCENIDIREAAKEALLRIKVSCTTVVKLLDAVISWGHQAGSPKRLRRENFLGSFGLFSQGLYSSGGMLFLLNSVLEILLLKKDIENRHILVKPLFNVLRELCSGEWLYNVQVLDQRRPDFSADTSLVSDAVVSAQQSTLLILENICTSATATATISEKHEITCHFNVDLLAEFVRSTTISTTRNHVFLLLSAFAKISPDGVFGHILDLFGIIGESATKQSDVHSQQILEDLISTLVTCWLSRTDSTKALLEVFLQALPRVAEHMRLKLMVYLLRTMGEKNSLGTFLSLMFRAMVMRKNKPSVGDISTDSASFAVSSYKEWEYLFSEAICGHFPCSTWLPCLVLFLEEVGKDTEDERGCVEMLLALHFIIDKLQDTELLFELESGHTHDHQGALGQLMNMTITRLQVLAVQNKQYHVPTSVRKSLREAEIRLLKCITKIMEPSEFFKGTTELLGHVDMHVRQKALRHLHDALKNDEFIPHDHRHKKKNRKHNGHPFLHMDDATLNSFNKLCFRIIDIIDASFEDANASLKLISISCLEVFASILPSNSQIFLNCLAVVVKHIASSDLSLSSSSLRCVARFISALGSKALVELPNIMKNILQRSQDSSACLCEKTKYSHTSAHVSSLVSKSAVVEAVLICLEVLVEHLSCFLSPYLEDIMKLLVTCSDYILESDLRIKSKAVSVRKLIVDKIHVRLTLSPLLKIYPEAVKCGEVSLSFVFEMLATAIKSMDRSSVGFYHGKIFEQCLIALDLRRLHPESIENIDIVEKAVIHTIVVLTMKLTESMFRPLFLRTLEWTEIELQATESGTRSMDRAISFFCLVNELLEHQRSLFVPYFKYLLDGIKQYLSDDYAVDSVSLFRKRKKNKTGETCLKLDENRLLYVKLWHLRALIISSLHKCFLYDSGNLKFLDSSNFQVLLKPITSQLVIEPHLPAEHISNLPTVEEVDESLVCCLGQMAVTAGSDDIWKQLNHEVLMQTRNEKIRPRILGLRVVKFLMEHLKEEYLVLLPETIPFLSELLEDVEHPVKSLAQEIFKELETLSGEDLKQYL